jgi:hypothetical protein
MPFQYAIEEIVPRPTTPLDNINRWNSDLVYHPVSKEVAETNENGLFSLITHNGDQVGNWIFFNNALTKKTQKSIDSVKNSSAPHKDIMGVELAVGDYVAMTHMETADLHVGKVLAFTEKKVRILSYSHYGVSLKNATGLIKIDPTVLSD